MPNKLFTKQTISRDTSSRVRTNREYLLAQDVAEDINTYRYFGVFKSWNEIQTVEYTPNTDSRTTTVSRKFGPIGTPAVRSIFNRAGHVLIGTDGIPKDLIGTDVDGDFLRDHPSGYRVSMNAPLLDSPDTRKKIRQDSDCTIRDLVRLSSEGKLGRAIYSYADFMYCKHLGQVSNNYLITLRRFPIPPGDNISTIGLNETKLGAGKNNGVQQIGCLVNWLGTPGNEMQNILKYTFSMPYIEAKAEWEQVNNSADSGGGILNGIAAGFDSAYRKQYTSGHGGAAFNRFAGVFLSPLGKYGSALAPGDGPYDTQFIDKNNNVKIYGNIDKVKSIYRRGEDGLAFDQSITLTFDYELRAYNGINARQAMLDLLSNILNVTFTTGGWWGGGYIGGGMHQNSIFNNLEIFKVKGGFTEFMDAFQKDYSTVTSSISGSIQSQGGWVNAIKNFLNNLGGMLLGGMLNKLGRPARAMTNSLLSEQPTGMWHLMIGNPNHPIMSMGNMVLKNTTIQHYGPLGIDDFPIGLKVTCELVRGKSKDLSEIEKMYMHGNEKISYSMGTRVLDMYKAAAAYKSGKKIPWNPYSSEDKVPLTPESSSTNSSVTKDGETVSAIDNNYLESNGVPTIKATDPSGEQNILMKWFGEKDSYSIYFTAAEQSWGAQKDKPKKETKEENTNGNTNKNTQK